MSEHARRPGISSNAASPVSTGHLPRASRVEKAVAEAHRRFRGVTDGANASHYPALAAVDPGRFGIAVASVEGAVIGAGDVDVPFTIMSVAKPFVLAIVCDALGPAEVRRRIGVNATGLPFDSVMALELQRDRLTNPMVNTGALATTSLVAGRTAEEKWATIADGLARFAGRPLELDADVYASASATNHRNRGLARFLEGYGRLYHEALETVDVYTRQSALRVTARDLAVMGATLAAGGVNPLTGQRAASEVTCRRVLAVMATAGLYETSGDWLYDVGLPGKSGVGGGIVTVAPGKGGLATFSPPLDGAGNSVRGQLAAAFLADELGLNVFASRPARPAGGSRPGEAAGHR